MEEKLRSTSFELVDREYLELEKLLNELKEASERHGKVLQSLSQLIELT
jgi:hypothetical protein